MVRCSPVDTFSLLCRVVAEVTPKSTSNGNNMPLLLLFRVIMAQRDLAFPHTPSETLALASFMTSTFQMAKLQDVIDAMSSAFRVVPKKLDMGARVTVCCV